MGVNLLLAKSLTLSLLVSVRFQFHFDDLPEKRSKGVGPNKFKAKIVPDRFLFYNNYYYVRKLTSHSSLDGMVAIVNV